MRNFKSRFTERCFAKNAKWETSCSSTTLSLETFLLERDPRQVHFTEKSWPGRPARFNQSNQTNGKQKKRLRQHLALSIEQKKGTQKSLRQA